jgi:DNA-binding response OmpR family regulator
MTLSSTSSRTRDTANRDLADHTRILVVTSDKPSGRGLLRDLDSQGFEVRATSSFDGVMSHCAHREYDVVLVDLSLGAVDGFALCRELGEEPGRPMVLMITPPAGDTQRLEGFAAGADDCVSKPVVGREVGARLRALARRRRRD